VSSGQSELRAKNKIVVVVVGARRRSSRCLDSSQRTLMRN